MQQAIRKKIDRIHRGEIPRVLDLFAGAGGLSLGFWTAGFQIVGAVENDPIAAKTHAENFFRGNPEEDFEKHAAIRDITTTEPEELVAAFGLGTKPENAVDVIIGGPPCQAFARVGRAKLRDVAEHPDAFLQDPRANLYLRFIHYVRVLQPLIILMENVPDALNYGGHNIAEETCELLAEELGYNCGYTLLNSALYGVPQMRERMFLLAYARELKIDFIRFPSPTHWIELPQGYKGSRSVALNGLKNNKDQLRMFEKYSYIPPPQPNNELMPAVSVQEALSDLPEIFALELLEKGQLKRGVRDPSNEVDYPVRIQLSNYGRMMRCWRGFETDKSFSGHIIRYLPRDYKLFARMTPGDQYPELYRLARRMFREELVRRCNPDEQLQNDLEEIRILWKEYVPPYDPYKFPNKWYKLEPDKPSRTLMAHLGKDSYSHIHYDSNQARTISVREAARLQTFPDGFRFKGKMNAAFKQIGNAVPPLMVYHIAMEVIRSLGQEPKSIFSAAEPD